MAVNGSPQMVFTQGDSPTTHLTKRAMTVLSKRTGAGLGLSSVGSSIMASCMAQCSMKVSGWCSCKQKLGSKVVNVCRAAKGCAQLS